MTSSEFVKLLEAQEANEIVKQEILINNEMIHSNTKKGTKSSRGLANNSYLDKDAKIPFKRLKKTCTDLGFTFSDQEWRQLAITLNANFKENETYAKNFKLLNEYATNNFNEISAEQDITVRNGDFFAALHETTLVLGGNLPFFFVSFS